MADWQQQVQKIAQEMTDVPQILEEEIPDIDLYMDQLTTYLEKRLDFFQRDEKTPLITGTMVNNYSKAGLVHASNRKRYSKLHVMTLSLVCQLKRLLSIQDMGRLAAPLETEEDLDEVYQLFLLRQKEQFAQTPQLAQTLLSRLEESGIEEQEKAVTALVTQLITGAQRDVLLAERIIDSLAPVQPKGKNKRSGND
ncbi:MAG: DUF1836 domain-containing protein [Angelakisella sp.]|nr:DUF1836 domain-containing protein [Angelakisella sp.]